MKRPTAKMRTTIRIPDDLRIKIKKLAVKQDRSMNQMITHMLKIAIKSIKSKGE